MNHIKHTTFSTLYFDITYKCNMNCNICYNSNLLNKKSDMSLNYFKNVFELLPKKSKPYTIRLLGGEPTLNDNLYEYIKIINTYKHIATVGTNGIKFADKNYIQKVKTWKNKNLADLQSVYKKGDYPFCLFFDMSGGTKYTKYYEKLNSKLNLNLKVQGLKNCIDIGIRSLGVTAIIIRDFNEEVIPDLIEFSLIHKLSAIHFRTMGKKGKWLKSEPYSLEELKDIVRKYIPDLDSYTKLKGYETTNTNKCNDCCYRFIPYKGMSINLIEFDTYNATNCWKRGYVNDDYTITPFFERIKLFG